MTRKDKTPRRQPHPDGRIELKLQQIISLQQAIIRHELLVAEYLAYL